MSALQTTPRVFLKNILFATDFSAASERALPFLRTMARQFGATVFVATVCPVERVYEIPVDPLPPEYMHNRQTAEAQMRAFVEIHDLNSLPLKVFVEQGEVWPGLEHIITENDIDLIVLGTRGRSGLSDMLLGSVAEEVIRRATCPVMTVGPHVSFEDAKVGAFTHILFATNFSAASEQALLYALLLTQENHAHFSMVHVVEEANIDVALPFPQDEIERTRQQMHDMLPEMLDLPFAPEMFVEVGVASDMVLQIAKHQAADLIVMGSHRTATPHASAHAPWHMVHHVVSHAHCPVLTVGS